MAEKEYIEREAALNAIKDEMGKYSINSYPYQSPNPFEDFRRGLGKAYLIIKKQPTADVQEIVRCEDCRYRGDGDICPMFHLCWSVSEGYYWENFTMDDKFCSCGEKRMDGDSNG